MKYKCLILDHDDTVVNSTETVNYVSFRQVLDKIRPDFELTLEDFHKYNFEPGFMSFCLDILKFTPDEMDFQVSYWKNFISKHLPNVYDGMKDLLWNYVDQGGKIFVISHSTAKDIQRHYEAHQLPKPQHIYGWEYEESKRKPSVWPIEDILSNHGFDRSELIMVDDLKPGKIMADNAGINFACAGWAHQIPEIVHYMRKETNHYCESVEDLKKIIL